MFIYIAILAAVAWIAYQTGRTTERENINQQIQQQVLFNEQLDAERKKAADETRKQLKFENDERERIRKRIEKEETAQRRTSLSPSS